MKFDIDIRDIFLKIYPLLISLSIFIIFATHKMGVSFPPGLNHDAAWNGLYAVKILNGSESFSVYTPEAWGRETLFHYVISFFYLFTGINQTGIELASIFFGFLSIISFFLLSSLLTKKNFLIMVTTIVWSSSTALIIFSRTGWRLITLLPIIILALIFAQLYIKTPRALNAIMFGVTSALLLYTYNSGRSFIIFFLVFWIILFSFSKNKLEKLDHALMSAIAFSITAFPMLQYAAANFNDWMGRANALKSPLSDIPNGVLTSLMFFNINSRGDDFFTNFPLLEGPASILWIVGMIIAVVKLKKYWIYILAFFVFLLPSVVAFPSYHRAIGTLPLVYVFVAITIITLSRIKLLHRQKKVVSIILISFVAIQILTSWERLYVSRLPFMHGYYPEAKTVGQYIKGQTNQRMVVLANNWPVDTLIFTSTNDFTDCCIESFLNYQQYTSGVYMPTDLLIQDIQSRKISDDYLFIVDVNLETSFLSNLARIGRKADLRDRIIDAGKRPIASVYSIPLYSAPDKHNFR